MLLALSLRDFVIVDRLEIEFGAGFTALTGETGAGKSILLDALALAMGARADAGVVREGATRADIGALFSSDEGIDAWLAERDLAGDPGSVLLRRVIVVGGVSLGRPPSQRALPAGVPRSEGETHASHASHALHAPAAAAAAAARPTRLSRGSP